MLITCRLDGVERKRVSEGYMSCCLQILLVSSSFVFWGVAQSACRNSTDSDIEDKNSDLCGANNDCPIILLYYLFFSYPNWEECLCPGEEHTHMGLPWCCNAPSCIYGPPAYAYIMGHACSKSKYSEQRGNNNSQPSRTNLVHKVSMAQSSHI